MRIETQLQGCVLRKAYASIFDLRKYYASFELKITRNSHVIMVLNDYFAEILCFLSRKYYGSSDTLDCNLKF